MANRERMSSIDTAWLKMEQPTNLMMITGVMSFAEPLDFDALKQTLEERFLSHRRFRQKAVTDLSGSYWEDDAYFDIEHHVQRIALPGDGGQKELEILVSNLGSTPLDMTRPLWQFHLVDGYNGGSALIMRIHHCYADGIAMIQVLLSMTDDEPVSADNKKKRTKKKGDSGASLLGGLFEPVSQIWAQSSQLVSNAIESGLHLTTHPAEAAALARRGIGMMAELAKVTTLPSDPPTRLKGELGMRKNVAWADPLPLEEIKAVGKAMGCTVNDVLMSVVAGALGGYLSEHGDEVEGLEIRASVPVNLRETGKVEELGNWFGLVFLPLPIGIKNPIERLFVVHRHMHDLKNSDQPAVALGILYVLGATAGMLERPVLDLLSTKVSLVVSNVPGPQHPLFFCGREISQQMFWVPQTGSIGIGVSILSYNGRVQFGLIADPRLIAEPHVLVERFGKEFEKLLLSVLLGVSAYQE